MERHHLWIRISIEHPKLLTFVLALLSELGYHLLPLCREEHASRASLELVIEDSSQASPPHTDLLILEWEEAGRAPLTDGGMLHTLEPLLAQQCSPLLVLTQASPDHLRALSQRFPSVTFLSHPPLVVPDFSQAISHLIHDRMYPPLHIHLCIHHIPLESSHQMVEQERQRTAQCRIWLTQRQAWLDDGRVWLQACQKEAEPQHEWLAEQHMWLEQQQRELAHQQQHVSALGHWLKHYQGSL